MTTENRAVSPDPVPSAPHPLRRLRRRPILLFFIFVATAIAATAALAAIDAIRAASDIRAGRAMFRSIAKEGLSSPSRLEQLAAAGTARFEAAEARAKSSPWIGGWARIPFVGSPARWLKAATGATAGLARQAKDAIGTIAPKLDAAHDPAGRLALLDVLTAQLGRLRVAVGGIHLPGAGWYFPPVSGAAGQLNAELSKLTRELDDGAVAVRGLRSFLNGPSTYLVLAANNSEMRAGGMVLQAGLLHSEHGSVQAGGFRSTGELALGASVPVPSEIQTLYGWLDPGKEWRNTGSSPNFPVVAPMYASMAQRTALGPVEGAIQLDVPALRSILGVIGPVEVGGRTYTARNIVRLVMHDLYVQFGSEQISRHHEFSELASAAFAALTQRRWDTGSLFRALGEAASGRHILLWSARPPEEEAWHRLGVDGALDRDGLMVTIQNHTGNKEDYFLRPTVEVSVRDISGFARRVTLRIHIANPTPADEPTFVLGNGSVVAAGDYRALVSVYLPGWAENVSVPGNTPAIVGPDGPMRVIGTRVTIPLQRSSDVTVVFDAPFGADRLIVLPSGRYPGIPFRKGGSSFDDTMPRPVVL